MIAPSSPTPLSPTSKVERVQPFTAKAEATRQMQLPATTAMLEEELRCSRERINALEASEARFRRLLEEQVDPICCFQQDLTITYCNRAYRTLFGEAHNAVMGQRVLAQIPSQYHSSVMQSVHSLTASDSVVDRDIPMLLATGETRWYQWTYRLIGDGSGSVIEYQGVGRDITERRQYDERQQGRRRLAEEILRCLAALTTSQSIDGIMDQIVVSATNVVPCRAGSIILFEEEYGRVAYLHGFSAETTAHLKNYRFTRNMDLAGRLWAADQSYLIPDTQNWPDWMVVPDNAWIRSSLGVPIFVHGQVIGRLTLDSDRPNHFEPHDVEKLQVFAQYASLALEKAYHVTFLEERVVARTNEVQAAKEQVEAILHYSPDAILLLQFDLQIMRANPAFAALFGRPANGSLLDLIHPDDRATVQAYAARITTENTGQPLEIRAVHYDRTVLDVELSLGVTKEVGLVCILRDVTERKRAQLALAEERTLLRTLIDTIPDVIFMKDRQHRFTLCNHPPVSSIRPVDPNSYLGKTDFDIHPPEVAERFRAEEQTIFETGKPLPLHELKLVRDDGSTVWLQATKVPLRNQQGEIVGLAGISHDISMLKRTMEAFAASEERFRTLIETMGSGLIICDHGRKITYANEKFCTLLSYSYEEIIGTSFEDYLDQTVLANQHPFVAHLEGTPTEVTVLSKYGARRHWLVSTSPLYDEEHQIVGKFSVVTDTTLQKMAELALEEALRREKELNELKTRFVSMTSHEFRTPLTSILLMAETIHAYRHKLSDSQIEERLLGILEQGQYLKGMMEDVLELARIQAGRTQFEPVLIDLDCFCRSLIEDLRAITVAHTIVYNCAQSLPAARVDKRLMRQILTNLIMNAIKYSSTGHTVDVRLEFHGEAFVLEVTDEGIGIPEADIPHLFTPFHRASNVGVIQGTGLGLVIAKESVELHGGTIQIESKQYQGTTVTVTIPLVL